VRRRPTASVGPFVLARTAERPGGRAGVGAAPEGAPHAGPIMEERGANDRREAAPRLCDVGPMRDRFRARAAADSAAGAGVPAVAGAARAACAAPAGEGPGIGPPVSRTGVEMTGSGPKGLNLA